MVFVLLLAAFGALLSAPSHSQQLHCLYEFYDALQGDSWWVRNNWPASTQRTEDEDYCQFYGITCDSSGNVEGITMPGNNLFGVLPTCIINFPLKVLSVPHNRLRESIPYIKNGIEVLNLEDTEIMVLATDMQAWTTVREMNLHKGHFGRMLVPNDFIFYSNMENLDFSDAGIGFYAWGLDFTTISTPKLSLAGMDLSEYIMSNVAKDQMKTLDVSGTWVKYRIKDFNKDFLDVYNMVHMPFQYTLMSSIINFSTLIDMSSKDVRSINIRGTNTTGVFDPEKWMNFVVNQTRDDFYMLDMSYNGLSGYGPTLQQYETVLALKPSARYLSLELNSFFCDYKESRMFGCSRLRIYDAYYLASYERLMVLVDYSHFAYAPLRDLQYHMSVIFRNITKYKTETDPIKRIQNIETYNYIHARSSAGLGYFCVDVTIPYDEAVALGLLEMNKTFVGILYDGHLISGRSFNLVHEVGLDKGSSAVDASEKPGRRCTIPSGCTVDEDYDETKDPVPVPALSHKLSTHDEDHRKDVAKKLISGAKKAEMNLTWTYLAHESEQKIAVDTFAMSRCGDFYERLNTVILPLFDKYPEITEIAQFKHFSMSEYNPRYSNGGLSKHGYEEVKGDIQLLCAQEYVDTHTFYDILKCLSTEGGKTALPRNFEHCLHQVASGKELLNKIIYCSNGEFGRALLEYSYKQKHKMSVANSPDIFIGKKMVCHGTMAYCVTTDADSFAQQICQAFIREKNYTPDICNSILS
ncbi:Leucine rich repeat family, N-terminal domain protein [Giardia duodenalis]|uniref:Leucine rich repeat family, N-terminal domain protein n=1 Tax=Giardia intestinalis TaxID=5741 RepID=Q8WSI4_GIAIN|nr:virus receptor protein [Giardia intestinalis]ESU38865.1 Leucine rich repeat family, N-terminal domain protein [Giardia intestinalis]